MTDFRPLPPLPSLNHSTSILRFPQATYPPQPGLTHDNGKESRIAYISEMHHARARSSTMSTLDRPIVEHETEVDNGNSKDGAATGKKRKSQSGQANRKKNNGSNPVPFMPIQPYQHDDPSPPILNPPPTARRISNQGPSNNTNGSLDSPPAVLTREKKQKACSNCRKAKLKCIVDEGATDCLRCSSRKEKCIFYPRAHDEDWQQTLTTDLYGAITHLSDLSRAVSHILHHLTAQNVIPPYAGRLQSYEPTERELAILQGWGAEKNRELPEKKIPEKRKRQGEDEDVDRDSSQQLHYQPNNTFPSRESGRALHTTTSSRSSDLEMTRLRDHEDHRLPPLQVTVPPALQSATIPDRPPPSVSTSGLARSDSHIPSVYQHIPSFISDATLPIPPSKMPPPPPPVLPPIKHYSPQDLQSHTPGSIVGSSPSVPIKTPGEWSNSQNMESMQHTTGGSDSTSVEMLIHTPSDTRDEPERLIDEEGFEVYGSADTRRTIIKDGIISAVQARNLVGFFHRCMAPNLFGYRLQEGHFPYLSDGFRSMTPFILAVECLLASERVVEMQATHKPLAAAVMRMMNESPAESWQTFAGSKKTRSGGGDEHSLRDAFLVPEDEMIWDPELGIGPEEIVAICALAAFISQGDRSFQIAIFGFKWAQGWTGFLQEEPQMTFAEATALVTPLRRPNIVESTRIWLLAYVNAGLHCLKANKLSPSLPLDPSHWCKIVLPDSSSDPYSPHDIVLVYHAKLVGQLLNWLAQRGQMPRFDDRDGNFVKSYIHLTSRIDQELDWWVLELKEYNLEAEWTKQIMLNFLHAKILVHTLCAQHTIGSPIGERQRKQSRITSIEMSIELLKRVLCWDSPDTLTQLPEVYFKQIIGLAVSNIVMAMVEIEEGKMSRSGCPISASDALRLLCQLLEMLESVNLPDGHYVKYTTASVRRQIDELHKLHGFERSVGYM